VDKRIISVITPCFNEGVRVIECSKIINKIFAEELPEYKLEHIFCDNASSDNTQELIKELCRQKDTTKAIFNSRNFGILPNTYNGVMAATGDAVIMFMPVDLQDPPELIPEFIKHWEEGYEIVFGIRKERKENFFLRNLRHFYYQVISFASFTDYPADVGDYQLVDRRIIDSMKLLTDNRPFLRMLPFEIGGKKIGIPYTWKKNIRKSKNNFTQFIDQGLTGIIAFSVAPMRVCLTIGFFISLFSLGYMIYFLISYLGGNTEFASGIRTLIVSVFFFGGLNLFFLGLIGEYILSIFFNTRRSTVVYEKERLNF
jgi:glycosyltransferase involved in cell wall biosynthesis